MSKENRELGADFEAFHQACTDRGFRPAYVLLRDKKAFEAGWPDLHPSLDRILRHLSSRAEHSVGIQPASLGCVVLDCDEGDGPDAATEWAGAAHVVTMPSSSGASHKGHVWVRCASPSDVRNWNFKVEDPLDGKAIGELRSRGGQVRLNATSLSLLTERVSADCLIEAEAKPAEDFHRIRSSKGAAGHDLSLDWDEGREVEIDGLGEPLRDAIVEGVPEGERSEALARIVWRAMGQGVSASSVLSILEEHCAFAVEKYGDRLGSQVEKLATDYLATREQALLEDFDVVEPGEVPEGARPDGSGNPVTEVVLEMNETFCAVLDGGQFQVFMEEPDTTFEGRTVWTKLSREAFRHYFEDETMAQVGERKRISRADLWLSSPHRRKYPGIVMDPEGLAHNEGKLNLWKGWGIEAKSGDWSMMQELIGDVLCDGDAASADYVTRWIAHMLQRPWETPEVAIAFRGEEGTGKGTLGRALMQIAGQHGLTVSHKSQFAGRFNAHLRNCIFLFADEAVWPGDKEGEAVLKQLVTEPILSFEAKGRDITQGRNMVHLMMASNEEWVVPAGPEARRFFVSDVSDRRRQDQAFFGRLAKQMQDGGLAAMVHDLTNMELGGWRPAMEVPQTRALADQKLRSMKPAARFWFTLMSEGALPVPFDEDCNEIDWRAGSVTLGEAERGQMVEAYDAFLKRNQLRSERASLHILVQEGKRLFGLVKGKRNRGKERTWEVPSLDEARARFEARIGATDLFC
ncbi:MAG: DUF5906 domain-containing protein [Pseudomonadota bacterium]